MISTMTRAGKDSEADVLIVGAGPTGCTLALLLARLGIPVALVERRDQPQQHPAACILNTRTLEVFREIGLEAPVRAAAQDVFERGLITWVVSLAGRELGRCCAIPDEFQSGPPVSPTHTMVFPQHRLEPMLWRRVEDAGIPFHRQHECLRVNQGPSGVTATFASEVVRHASYLVACDGASSSVRRSLGLAMNGPILQHMIGIHFLADLGRFVEHRKGVLYWVLNRDVLGVLIAHWLPTEWVLFTPYFPPQQSPDRLTPPACRELIAAAVGTRDLPGLEVRQVGAWVLSARLAQRLQLGRVFLAGDAAHTFPPTGGWGLNTGVQEAHNLAWKLAAVLRGRASPQLLQTYEAERRPVAEANLQHSVRNYETLNELNKVVGLDLGHLRKLTAVQNSRVFRALPGAWQRGLVDAALRWARKRLSLLDSDGSQGDRARARFRALLPDQAPHYRSLGLDLGFAYTQGAVIPEASPQPQADDPVEHYRPTTWPGSRLPHFWVHRGEAVLALHDVLDPEGFLLLTDVPGGQTWRAAARSLQADFAMPVTCLTLGEPGAADLVDPQSRWPSLSEVGPGGAVLVRPDGHVAWRCTHPPAAPAEELRMVLERLLGSTNEKN
jgi:2-polyprenyl-6-methoxyphenol hydroxylase-like FAD-dependent oxidoreductase